MATAVRMEQGPAPRLDLLAHGDKEFVCTKCGLSKQVTAFRSLTRCGRTRRTIDRSPACLACENASDLLVSRAIRLERTASDLRIRAGQLMREALELRLQAGRTP